MKIKNKRLGDLKHAMNGPPLDCLTCTGMTYFRDMVCMNCRMQVPDVIPYEQVYRYLKRIERGPGCKEKNWSFLDSQIISKVSTVKKHLMTLCGRGTT